MPIEIAPSKETSGSESKEIVLESKDDKVCTLELKKEVDAINSLLPFATIKVFNKQNGPETEGTYFSALLDSGASCNLANSTALNSTGLKYKDEPTDRMVKSFTGNSIKILSQVILYLSFGNGIRKPCKFLKYEGDTNYSLLVGWQGMVDLKIELSGEKIV